MQFIFIKTAQWKLIALSASSVNGALLHLNCFLICWCIKNLLVKHETSMRKSFRVVCTCENVWKAARHNLSAKKTEFSRATKTTQTFFSTSHPKHFELWINLRFDSEWGAQNWEHWIKSRDFINLVSDVVGRRRSFSRYLKAFFGESRQ